MTLHSWKEAALSLHELLEEKSERATVATLQELRSLPFLLHSLDLLLDEDSRQRCRVPGPAGLVSFSAGIGLLVVVMRMRRNHLLIELRVNACKQSPLAESV